MNYTGVLSVRLRLCSPATVSVLIGSLLPIVLQRTHLEDSLNNKPPPLPSHTSHMHVIHVRNKNNSTEFIIKKKSHKNAMDVLKNRYKCQLNVLSGIDGRGHFKTVLIFLRRTLYKAIEKYQNLTA